MTGCFFAFENGPQTPLLTLIRLHKLKNLEFEFPWLNGNSRIVILVNRETRDSKKPKNVCSCPYYSNRKEST